MQIEHLFKFPQYKNFVAEWIYKEFWADKPNYTANDLLVRLNEAATESEIPLSLLAIMDNKPVGTINFIEHDDEQLLHLTPWLAALYVLPEYRNKKVATNLIAELLRYAKKFNVTKVYLGTDNPSFYQRLGAKIHLEPRSNFYILYFVV